MDINTQKNIIRIGKVSSVNVEDMTAKVVFPDKNNLISAELHMVNRGSLKYQDYWIPDIDEQVLCVFLPNVTGRGVSEGFILGSFFSKISPPQSANQNIRRVDFGDGSYIEHDRSTGNMTIHATGNIKITGANIYINE